MVSSDLFLDIADAYAWRSTCLRRRFGSVIIDARFDDPIAGGFNGAPIVTGKQIGRAHV